MLIAEGGGAISMMVVTVLFLPGLVWVDIGVAQAHVSRSACKELARKLASARYAECTYTRIEDFFQRSADSAS